MSYKTDFKSFVPETEFEDMDGDRLLNLLWKRIQERYPKQPNLWGMIYLRAEEDFFQNYDTVASYKIVKTEEE